LIQGACYRRDWQTGAECASEQEAVCRSASSRPHQVSAVGHLKWITCSTEGISQPQANGAWIDGYELSESVDPNSSTGLEDLARFSVTIKDGTPACDIRSVIASGNSDGQHVITSRKGKVVSVERVAVIGVSTYLIAGRRDICAKDTDFR
jgi:hypothetical protein